MPRDRWVCLEALCHRIGVVDKRSDGLAGALVLAGVLLRLSAVLQRALQQPHKRVRRGERGLRAVPPLCLVRCCQRLSERGEGVAYVVVVL